jgi:hypothetical protein
MKPSSSPYGEAVSLCKGCAWIRYAITRLNMALLLNTVVSPEMCTFVLT